MRIAFISREHPSAERAGGIGTYTAKTARALAGLGHEVHVITELPGSARWSSVDKGVHVHSLPTSRARPDEARLLLRSLAVARRLRQLGKFDVVQACEWEAEAAVHAVSRHGALVTRLATPSYLVNRLNAGTGRAAARAAVVDRLERWQARHSDIVISPSRALADTVAADWGMDGARIAVVPTGVDVDAIKPAALPDRDSPPSVLYFGRLEARKGVQTWIDALPAVLAKLPNVRAVFAGADLGLNGIPFREYAKRRLGDDFARVTFLPRLPQPELFQLVSSASLVVMPSLWESLANACLEAMAHGRAVLATDGSGFSEVITDGLDGRLVPPGDARRLAEVAVEALSDPLWLAAAGQAARRRAENFALEPMARRLESLYLSVLGRHELRVEVPA